MYFINTISPAVKGKISANHPISTKLHTLSHWTMWSEIRSGGILNRPFLTLFRPLCPFLGPFGAFIGSFEDGWGWFGLRWVWIGSGNFTHPQPSHIQVFSLPFCALFRPLCPFLGPFGAFIGRFEDGWGWVELRWVWVGSGNFTHPQCSHIQVFSLPFCTLFRPLWPFLGPFGAFIGGFEAGWGWVELRWVLVSSGNFTHPQPSHIQVFSLPFCALFRPLWPFLGPFGAFIGRFDDGWGWVELRWVWIVFGNFSHPLQNHIQVFIFPLCALLRALWPFLGPFGASIGSFEMSEPTHTQKSMGWLWEPQPPPTKSYSIF